MEYCRREYCIFFIFSLLSFVCTNAAVAEKLLFCPNQSSASTCASSINATLLTGSFSVQAPSGLDKKPKLAKGKQGKNKKVTFETFEQNYTKACEFYEKQMFISAARLFEELYPLSLGTPRADTILYLFADCYYQNKDYEMAAYHFKEYANKYTNSTRAEDAHFKAIQAISHLSPDYNLDQTETYYVIEEIQVFIRRFPYSSHMEECNELLDAMREKLAKKAFEILKLYYDTENYRSAQVMAANFFKEYGASKYADDAYAVLVKNNYEFARKSVEAKKAERYSLCVDAFNNMRINQPDSPLIEEVQKYADEAQLRLNRRDAQGKVKENKRVKYSKKSNKER